MPKTKTMSLRLPVELYERLRKRSFDDHIQMNQQILEAINFRYWHIDELKKES